VLRLATVAGPGVMGEPLGNVAVGLLRKPQRGARRAIWRRRNVQTPGVPRRFAPHSIGPTHISSPIRPTVRPARSTRTRATGMRTARTRSPSVSILRVLSARDDRFMTTALLILHALLGTAAIVVSLLGVQARAPEKTRSLASVLLGVVALQTVAGDVLYPIYLRTAKPALRALSAGSRTAAEIFEVKEHLAFLALVFVIGAFVLTRTEPRPNPLLRVLFGCAHGTIIVVAVLGLVVASLRTP
jgi:hypothetical protein